MGIEDASSNTLIDKYYFLIADTSQLSLMQPIPRSIRILWKLWEEWRFIEYGRLSIDWHNIPAIIDPFHSYLSLFCTIVDPIFDVIV